MIPSSIPLRMSPELFLVYLLKIPIAILSAIVPRTPSLIPTGIHSGILSGIPSMISLGFALGISPRTLSLIPPGIPLGQGF